MTEAQNILRWIQSVGVSDREIANYLSVSRETIVRVRGAKNRCNGATFLTDLRTIARKHNMPGYTASPIPRVHKSPVTPSVKSPVPRVQKPAKPARTYTVGTVFNCPHCHFRNTARMSNSYCVNCETPYNCILH